MIARPLDRSGICVCSLPVALHFDARDRYVSCDLAKARFLRGLDATRTPTRILPFVPRRQPDAATIETCEANRNGGERL